MPATRAATAELGEKGRGGMPTQRTAGGGGRNEERKRRIEWYYRGKKGDWKGEQYSHENVRCRQHEIVGGRVGKGAKNENSQTILSASNVESTHWGGGGQDEQEKRVLSKVKREKNVRKSIWHSTVNVLYQFWVSHDLYTRYIYQYILIYLGTHLFFFIFLAESKKKKERETMGIRGTTPRQRGGKTLTDEKTQPAEPEIACSSLPQVYAKIFHFWNFQFMV